MGTMSSLLAIVCLILVPSLVKTSRNVDSLYFTNLNNIQLLDNNLTTIVFGGLELAESLDCNICDQKIYWVDQAGKIKRGTPNNQSSIEVIISNDLHHPIGLAIDWKGNNVYFSDTRNTDDLGRIEVASCDGKRRKVLLHNLVKPGPLALNVLTGYLYYVDYYKIMRADMDGQHPEEIYLEGDVFESEIKGLAVDIINGLLFWTVGNHIKYINLTDWEVLRSIDPVTVVRQMDSDPHGISVVNSTIYWTEQRIVNSDTHEIVRDGAIYSLDMATNMEQMLLQNRSLSPQDLSTFANVSVRQDGCSLNNGNCEHFCFTVPNGNGSTRAQCGCTTGIQLHPDNRTCPDFPSQFLLFTQSFENHAEIRQISLDFPGIYIDIQVPIYGLSDDVSFLSYDLVLHQIYWTEVDPPAIRRAFANGSCVETFIGTGLRHPEGLAVDSYSRNLYWVDSVLNRIEVARLSDRMNRRVLFSSDLDHPQGLALDLQQEFMYWTDLDTSQPKVERARMDGTDRADLPGRRSTIKIPTNIAVDPLTGWVYWSDTDNSIDKVSWYDGSQQTETFLTLTGLEDVFGLAVHGDYLYWTDRLATDRALVRARKTSGDSEEVILAKRTGLLGLIAVNSTAENVRTSCSISYGDCRQLCLPSGTMPSCACRDNFILTDSNQCEDSDPYAFISSDTKLAQIRITLSNGERWRQSEDSLSFNNSALTIDIDYRDSMLYWIGSEDKLIYRQYVNLTSSSEAEPVVSCCLVTPEDLAVDWLGRNLYWTDSTRRVIEVAKLNGRGRSILTRIPDNLGAPSFITLDPTRGYLYWVPKSEAKIYKMLMNGSSQSEVFWSSTGPTGKIIGLVVNYEETPNDVMYWGIQTPEGTDRDILMKQELNNPNSRGMEVTRLDRTLLHIGTFRKSVYYHANNPIFGDVIQNWNTEQHSDNLVLTRAFLRGFQDFTNFAIVHHSLQPGIHECSVMNRGCGGDATLCLISSGVYGVCQCPAWMAKRIEQDGTGVDRDSCINPDSLLLIATQEAILYLPVLPDTAHRTLSDPQPLPIGPLYNVSAVSYDPVNENVLWVDRETQFLHRATVDGRQFWNVAEIENVSVFSMTYDWIGGHIFITEDQGFQIELLTINGEGVGSFLLHDVQQTRNLPRPGDVIFDMDNSILYWTTLSRSGLGRSIQYMSLNNPNVTHTLNVSGKTDGLMIDKLTFEPSMKSLYWINRSNATNSTIERFDIQSSNLTIIATDASPVSALAAMTVDGRPYVFWYNDRDRAIYRYDGQNRNYSRYQYWTAPGPIVGFVGSERQPRITVPLPCLNSPRPCSHLCIRQQISPSYHCGCPSNRNLESDHTCSELLCEGVQSPCNDGFGCYPTAYYCDGINHCRNGYDETECPCDTTYQRGCYNSNTCLTNTSWCNGREECPHGEDEAPEGCCPQPLFGCESDGSFQCFQPNLQCDGMNDCDDSEDEENCPDTSSPNPTPMTTEPTSPSPPSNSIQLPIIITISSFSVLIVLVLFCIVCMAIVRYIHKRSAKFSPSRGVMIYKPSSSPSENGSLYYSETSGGTHLTHLDPYGNNLSPSSTDSTFKRGSTAALSTDPSNPPPSPITERQSAFVTTDLGIDGMSAISQPFSEYCESHMPPAPPAPSLNFDEMSSMSCSVSQRNVQVTMNGIDSHTHVHSHNRYGHGRNPLLAHNNHHYQQERYYHASYHYHQHNPYSHHFANHRPPHLHHAHFVRAHEERFDTQSDSESTLSMTTVNTDNQDDLPPPGRPPSPATMTEYSETHIHPLPSTSPISEDSEECSENFLHQE